MKSLSFLAVFDDAENGETISPDVLSAGIIGPSFTPLPGHKPELPYQATYSSDWSVDSNVVDVSNCIPGLGCSNLGSSLAGSKRYVHFSAGGSTRPTYNTSVNPGLWWTRPRTEAPPDPDIFRRSRLLHSAKPLQCKPTITTSIVS